MAFTRPKASQIDFDVTNISDPLIRLNSGQSGSADKDVGIVVERGSDTNVALLYDESANEFVLVNTTEDGTTSGNVTISSYADLRVAGLTASSVTSSGAIAMGTNKITGLGDPTANQDAATKAYVDSQVSSVPTGDITAVNITAGTGLSGTVSTSSGDHTQTLAIDSTVATLTGSQTLTNKTLTSPVISTISNTGTITLPTSTDTLVGRATTDTLTNKTLTSAVLNTGVSGTAVLDEDDMSSNSATQLATQQSIKAYVDTQLTAEDLDITSDSGTIAIDLDSETLTIAGGTGIDSSATSNTVTLAIDSTVATLTGTQTLENKTLRAPTFEGGSNAPEFLETRYVNATQQDFVQLYTGASSGSYFTQGEYQKVATIIPDGDSQNYTFRLRMTATSASNYQIVEFTGALRSNTLPDLDFTSNYFEEHNGTKFIEPKLWTKETTTAGFILAFEYVHSASLFGGVNVEATIIPRSDAQRANVTFNATQNSEQSSIDTGYTENDPTLIYANVSGTLEFGTQFRIEGSTNDDNELTITATDPTADRTITFPDATGTVSLITATETLTNKTLTNPILTPTATTAGKIEFLEGTNNGTNKATLIGPASTGDVTITLPAATDTIVGKATTDTLTNKTINGPDNTLTNIANSSLANSSITVARQGGNSTAVALGGTITFNNVANETTVAESSGTITIGLADAVTIPNLTVSQDATITGNLTVNGTTTTLSTTNSVVEDSLIELNTGASSNSNDLGFIFERGSTGNNAAFIWDESADKFTLGTTTSTGAATGNITVSSGTLVAALEGNADTATALATARNIAGQSFDGSGDITIASTDLSDTSNLVRNNQNNTITSTTAGSSAAPEFELFRDITGADSNYIGQIKFSADNDADQKTVFAKITGKIGDASDGTEDGIIEIAHIKAGSQNINVRMTSTEFKILNGTDFDIETHDGSSAGLRLNNTLVTSTAAELNILDGVTTTATELNIIDGDTSATSTTLADADRVVVNDAGTMKQVALTDFETYFETALDTLSNVTSVGTLNGLAVASSQTISLGSNRVQNVADPVGNQDAATKAYVDANAGSGGGASGFTASTFTTAPGSDGDFDLSFNVAQDTQENPFESGGTDAFGVALGEVYDMMEPVGSTSSVDLASL